MNRADLIRTTAACGLAAVSQLELGRGAGAAEPLGGRLVPPAKGSIPVAFLISEGAVVIDFAGPWEVFQDAGVLGRSDSAFELYTVAETKKPIRTSGGMQIVPDHDFASAPAPSVLVIPAQSDPSEAAKGWIRTVSRSTDVTMSVCTGAFVLARTGLLAGKRATTHHSSYKVFAMDFPDIDVRRGARFVEDGNLASSGGLSSGIDLALRVVERYFGPEAAARTADYMEYQGQGWLNASANAAYAKPPVSTAAHPICPVCWMDVDPKTAASSAFQAKTYYFCMPSHKQRFDSAPAKFLDG
jgi:putative intracellular protease/amidase/YHS domain-containing protein